MSQKDVWKDNRTSTASGIGSNEQHWLSSVAREHELVDETASQSHQEKVEDRG
jgi:hypothetical protein